jgi:hypothetical protein
MHHLAIGLAVATTLLLPAVTQAAPETYIGAGYGAYQFEENDLDESENHWKAYVGTMFNSAVGIELSYVDFSRAEALGSSFDADGYGAGLILALPVAENFSVYGKGGIFFWDAQSRFAGLSASDDGDDPFYGAGVQFRLNDALDLRVEYERYEIVDIDIDSATAALQFSF